MDAPSATSTNRYYAKGKERAGRVHDLFSRIAPRYDLINDLMSWGMHRRWKRRLAVLAAPCPGERALDLCCGTGDVAQAVATAVPEGEGSLSVIGLDFTEEMLDIARRQTSSNGLQFLRGDALALPFSDQEVDLITCAYGLRNLADLDEGLAEAHRVLRPGGRLVSLEFGRPLHPALSAAYFAYLRLALPLFGLLFFGDPHTYGYIFTTVSRFPGQHDLAERMQHVGFHPVEVHELMGGVMGICVARKGFASAPGAVP